MTYFIYKDTCSECGADVIRHNASRFGFCRGVCNILLRIPSYKETEKMTFVVSCQIGGGKWQKVTKKEYASLDIAIKKFCQ